MKKMLKLIDYVKGTYSSAVTVERRDGIRYKFIYCDGMYSSVIVFENGLIIRNASVEEIADLAQMVMNTPKVLNILTEEVSA
jgi:hypothetical protein